MTRTSVKTLTLPAVSRFDRWLETTFRFTRQRPLGAVGAAIIGIMIAAAVLAGFVAPYDPLATDYATMLQAPSSFHWFGTDSFGRDVLTRIIYGSRTALWIGFASAFLGATLGALIGVTSAYFGGKIDLVLQRFMDLLLSFPLIILALVVVSLLGSGMTNVIFAITVPMVPRCALVLRSSALTLREMPFVEAARALGFGPTRIILRHMLPNVMAPYLIMLTAFLGQAILLEASLSFLGLGVAEPQAAWGLMLRGAAAPSASRSLLSIFSATLYEMLWIRSCGCDDSHPKSSLILRKKTQMNLLGYRR